MYYNIPFLDRPTTVRSRSLSAAGEPMTGEPTVNDDRRTVKRWENCYQVTSFCGGVRFGSRNWWDAAVRRWGREGVGERAKEDRAANEILRAQSEPVEIATIKIVLLLLGVLLLPI